MSALRADDELELNEEELAKMSTSIALKSIKAFGSKASGSNAFQAEISPDNVSFLNESSEIDNEVSFYIRRYKQLRMKQGRNKKHF